MSLWQSYRNLTSRTRLLLGLGLMGWAGLGLMLSDRAEQALGMVPTDQDKEKLSEVMPRIRTVDKEP